MEKIFLPIDAFKNEILDCIAKNSVTIIVAETGAGKSTRVPQYLLEQGDYDIVVTQPRRLAARTVAKRVAEEMECRLGGLVGFRTAVDRLDSNETKCLFATDGLQLVRELTNAKKSLGRGTCLIIDEVHEWNLNIEVLIAWAKKLILLGTDIKIVLMSATLEAEVLSDFFDDAPVIKVPGRCYPVIGSPTHCDGVIQSSAVDIKEEIKRLVAEGSNSLVFLPGKGEIKQMENELKKLNLQAIIMPLHGDISSEEQNLVFQKTALPKVVLSTNIAQTSITIPDIDAVIDSGLERRVELINGVETLLLGNISQADCRQRAGRAGRVKEGEYVLCNNTPYSSFPEFPIPEIQRSLLDQLVLRLAGAGFDATELPFFHQPQKEVLLRAKKMLMTIGALDQSGQITKLGRNINRFPTSVSYARMMLEALNRKCLAPILSIIAVLSTRYGTLCRRHRDDDPEDFKSWATLLDSEKEYYSDLLVEYDLFKAARLLPKKQLAANGIDYKAFETAVEIREQIKKAISGLGYNDENHSVNKEDDIEVRKCILSGMLDGVYQNRSSNVYEDSDELRILDKDSVLQKLSYWPKLLVAEPMNISFLNRRGRRDTIKLIKKCTVIEKEWLEEIKSKTA